MATPTNRNIVQESPISMATTTTTEDEYCSTDESVLELRKILKTESRENRSRINSKRLLIKGGKVKLINSVSCDYYALYSP